MSMYLSVCHSIYFYPYEHIQSTLSFTLIHKYIHSHSYTNTKSHSYTNTFALIYKHTCIRTHTQTHSHSICKHSYLHSHTFVFIRKHAHPHSWINTHSHSYTHAFALVQTLRHKRFRTRVTIFSRQENTPFITCNGVKRESGYSCQSISF